MDSGKTNVVRTCLSHRGYSLVKVSYAMFAVLFVYWFSDSGWFDYNLGLIGLPIIVLIIVLAHFILLLLESYLGVKLFSWILKGKPPVFYLKWIELHGCTFDTDKSDTANDAKQEHSGEQDGGLEQPAFSYGNKRIKLDVIDELELSIWGNLLIKSYANRGELSTKEIGDKRKYEPDILAKLPLSAVNQVSQNEFIELVKATNPELVTNKRLSKRLESKIVKGEEFVKSLGAVFLSFVLLDLGFATGYFLEMQKHFYLSHALLKNDQYYSEIVASDNRRIKAQEEFSQGELMMKNRTSISLVQRALFDHGSAVGGVYQARAEALWEMNKKDEAMESLSKAHELYPKSLKLMIELARWKFETGDMKGSKEILEKAIEEHKEDMLPCLYMIAADKKSLKSDTDIEKLSRTYLEKLDEEVFGEEPWWPPGGNRFLSERLYRDDVIFLARQLLDLKIK